MTTRKISWMSFPFVTLWRLVSVIVEMTGRLLALVLGLLVMVVGLLLTLTLVGAIIGIPLLIFGFLLMLRDIF